MKRLAFIDHSFKKQSRSSAFLIDRLEEVFDVEIFWDESWKGGSRVNLGLISEGDFDILILFQQMSQYTIKELSSLNCSVILIPMYDSEYERSDLFWYKFSKFKFINFSKTLHQRLLGIGIDSLYCQYFPSPMPSSLSQQKEQGYSQLKGFFWQRRSEITWNDIKKLISQANFAKIHIHTAVDPPGYEVVLPSKEDRSCYEITTSNWFATNGDYLNKVAESHVYFAPRLYEGIGMAFLEAMAMGKCVVAPNHPTMSEYIKHGYNGLLYDPLDPQPLDFSNVKEMCLNARAFVSEGFTRWQTNLKHMVGYIKTPRRFRFHSIPVLRKRLSLHSESKKRLS